MSVDGRWWADQHVLVREGRITARYVNASQKQESVGIAAGHSDEARAEAAKALISNNARLLRDVCNTSSSNIDGKPLTQSELQRVDERFEEIVDEALREVTRRLLGRGKPITLQATDEASEARAACARYIHLRIQSDNEQMPGRTPDMSPSAAVATKACLAQVASTLWEPLYEALAEHGGEVNANADGAAGMHAAAPRREAVERILANHFLLVLDITNPTCLNVHKKELTQTELRRVPTAQAPHVDEALREATRRLLGFEAHQLLSESLAADEARTMTYAYLKARIQSSPQQKPGRNPDMSPQAAAAFLAVLAELAGDTSQQGHASKSSHCLLQ